MNPALDQLLRKAARTRDVVSFAGGLPGPETFPRRALARAAAAATQASFGDPLQYDWPEGRLGLRTFVADRLRARMADVTPDDVVITAGAQDALSLAIELLAPIAVSVDDPCYPGAIDLFRARGCVVDTEHARPLRYAMPALMNPEGRAMSARERDEALDAPFVIEDDAYAELAFAGPPPPPLLASARDRVFHVGSLSKVLAPGLRVGWLVPPRAHLEAVQEAKAQRDLYTGSFAQAVVEELLRRVDLEERTRRLRTYYRRRCARLVAALRTVPGLRFLGPVGGFGVWVETDLIVDDAELLARALELGVAYDPGCLFRSDEGRGRCVAMRLCFSRTPEDAFDRGVERLALLVRGRRAGAGSRPRPLAASSTQS